MMVRMWEEGMFVVRWEWVLGVTLLCEAKMLCGTTANGLSFLRVL